MAEWDRVTLGEVCDSVDGVIRTGPFGSQLHRADYVEDGDGTPVVMPKDIVDGRIVSSSIARIDAETVQRLASHRMLPGDIVMARRGDIGRRGLVDDRTGGWLCGTGSLRVSLPQSDLDPTFLYYYLGSEPAVGWLQGQAVGATMSNLNTDIVRRLEVPQPPLQVQRRIGAALAAYDELIENNLRRIEILEEMAQAIYREWFVNFRYPGHEDNELVDSALGLIPEGWTVSRLGDEIELAYGKALKKDDRAGGEVAVYGSSGVVGWHDTALAPGPGIVVGRKGNVGVIHWSDSDFYPIDTTFYVNTDLSLNYVFHNLRNQNFINSDAAVPGLNRNQAYANPLLVPPTDLLGAFDSALDPVSSLRRNLERQNANLRETRDLLLPGLVSGEIDVSDLNIDTSWLAS